jgi:hypothetical protein
MEGRNSVRTVMLLVLAGLLLATLLGRFGFNSATLPTPAKADKSKTADLYVGPLPATFTITGTLTGPDEEPGLELPAITEVRVDGTRAVMDAKRQVARTVGVLRLTGVETVSFDGKVDRTKDAVTGPFHWTLRGRIGSRTVDWRLDGTLALHFSTESSVKGRIDGTRVSTRRETSGVGSPEVSRGSLGWEYAGLRGK